MAPVTGWRPREQRHRNDDQRRGRGPARVTIGYCTLLNRRLSLLKSDEHSLRATISELVMATDIAERAIAGLKLTIEECEVEWRRGSPAANASPPVSIAALLPGRACSSASPTLLPVTAQARSGSRPRRRNDAARRRRRRMSAGGRGGGAGLCREVADEGARSRRIIVSSAICACFGSRVEVRVSWP